MSLQEFVRPEHYELVLKPDLNSFKFSGEVTIDLRIEEETNVIILNAAELAIWKAELKSNERTLKATKFCHTDKEELEIYFEDKISGNWKLFLEFEGTINDRMVGFYRSSYKKRNKTKYVAVTQFEESDARRAFPCFDHPSRKATFDISFIIDEDLVGISNGPIKSEEKLGNGKKRIIFERTPKMSTYLLFFGVGEFEFVEDPGKVTVRVAALPGKKKYTKFGLKFARKALEFCEDYFAVPFPIPKLDNIAVPDFAYGAMENWGAIIYRENLLLYYPKFSSKENKQRICEVIAHEITHQWFGNLVSPSDWKYLWLNESFATFFGNGIVAHYYPQWKIWQGFVGTATKGALSRDGLNDTFPIELPGDESGHVIINASTAPIIYSKGASILRMIENYLGKEKFRDGLRYYLKKHQYDNAASHHLWEALEHASKKPITEIMKTWIEQPGYPYLDVEIKDQKLLIRQKRFTFLPKDYNQTWHVPIIMKFFYNDGKSKVSRTLLKKETKELSATNVSTIKLNYGQTGFYRVKYPPQMLEALGTLIKTKKLSEFDRWGIQSDLYAFVRRGDYTLDLYLEYIHKYYLDEDNFLPAIDISENLIQSYRLLYHTPKIKAITETALEFYRSVLEKIQLEPQSGEKHAISLLRNNILVPAVLVGYKDAQNFVEHLFDKLKANEDINPDLREPTLSGKAWLSNGDVFDWVISRFKEAESEQERINLLFGLGYFKDPNLLNQSLNFILKDVPSRIKYIGFSLIAQNPYSKDIFWKWYQENRTELEKLHPIHYERLLVPMIMYSGIYHYDAITEFFTEYKEKMAPLKDSINLALEALEINKSFVERNK